MLIPLAIVHLHKYTTMIAWGRVALAEFCAL